MKPPSSASTIHILNSSSVIQFCHRVTKQTSDSTFHVAFKLNERTSATQNEKKNSKKTPLNKIYNNHLHRNRKLVSDFNMEFAHLNRVNAGN